MTTLTSADYWLANLLLAHDNTGYLFWHFHQNETLRPLLLDYVWQSGFAFDPELYQTFMVCEDYTFADSKYRAIAIDATKPVHPINPTDEWRVVGWEYARIWRNASTVLKWEHLQECAVQPCEELARLLRQVVLETRPYSKGVFGRIDPLWRYKAGSFFADTGKDGVLSYLYGVLKILPAQSLPSVFVSKQMKAMPDEWRWITPAIKHGDYILPMYVLSRTIPYVRRNLGTWDIEGQLGFMVTREVES